tara:strand:- start:1979 stop:2611 length:633 start_codon:yes stop_codon:yes gene_type:complete
MLKNYYYNLLFYNYNIYIMEKLIIVITLFILFICVYMHFENKLNDLIYVKSDIDGKEYLVQRYNDSKKAANLISKTRKKLEDLTNYCYEKYNNSATQRLKNKFDGDSIVEVGKGSKYTSYSINKGEKIVLCLRSRDGNNKLVDGNTLIFVAIHELSHIMTLSKHHQPEFWDNFRFLLKKAIEMGIYKNINYKKNPKPYCGITISSSPLFN